MSKLLDRAEALHLKAGMPWRQAERLALSELGIDDAAITELVGACATMGTESLLTRDEICDFARAVLVHGSSLAVARTLMTLEDAVQAIVERYGGVRAAARATGVDKGFISRLRNGHKVAPSETTLGALGLMAVPLYEVLKTPNAQAGRGH